VGWPSFRRFDVQARYSLPISLVSALPLALAVFAAAARYDHELRAIQFGSASLFRPAFLACVALAFLFAAVGAALGFNSAGQRRNHLQSRSWAGFFFGMAICSLSIVTLAAFWLLKLPVELDFAAAMILL
jgi:hypothetical protein